MRVVPLVFVLLLGIWGTACAQREPSATTGVLAVRVLDATGKPVSGVRLAASWGVEGTTTNEGSATLASGRGTLTISRKSGEEHAIPWQLPEGDAVVEITLRPMPPARTDRSARAVSLELPVRGGTGYVWHPVDPASDCSMGAFEKKTGDPALLGGPGLQRAECLERPAEGFVLARFGQSAGLAGLSYPAENGRRLYCMEVFLLEVVRP